MAKRSDPRGLPPAQPTPAITPSNPPVSAATAIVNKPADFIIGASIHLNAEAQTAITAVAQEATKQEQERTKQEQERSRRSADITTQSRHGMTKHVVSGVVVAALTGAAIHKPELAWPLVILACGTMGIANAPEIIRQIVGFVRGRSDIKVNGPGRNEGTPPPEGTSP